MANNVGDNATPRAKQRKESDDFEWEEGVTDVQLIVEDKPLSMNKGFLMSVSPVFKKMFLGDYKEKDAKKVPLPGKKYTEMKEFLHCLMQKRSEDLTDEKVDFLIPLADEYDTISLRKRCEDYLLGKYVDSEYDIFNPRSKPQPTRQTALKHIHLGIDYNCERLENKAKEHLPKCCLKDIDKDESFAKLKLEYRLEIYQIRINAIEHIYHESRGQDVSVFGRVMLRDIE